MPVSLPDMHVDELQPLFTMEITSGERLKERILSITLFSLVGVETCRLQWFSDSSITNADGEQNWPL